MLIIKLLFVNYCCTEQTEIDYLIYMKQMLKMEMTKTIAPESLVITASNILETLRNINSFYIGRLFYVYFT